MSVVIVKNWNIYVPNVFGDVAATMNFLVLHEITNNDICGNLVMKVEAGNIKVEAKSIYLVMNDPCINVY